MSEMQDAIPDLCGASLIPVLRPNITAGTTGNVHLADARGRFEWEQTSAQMALLVNMFREQKKSKPARAADFNPYFRKSSDQVMMNVPVSVLKDVFFKKKPGGC